MWDDAARELGAHVTDLPEGFLEIRKGSTSTRVWQQFVMLDDNVTLRFANEKVLVARLLGGAGLPVPEQLEFERGSKPAALEFLERKEGPCVVKPAGGTSGGLGTTSGISSAPQLARAVLRASRFGTRLAIERQAPGTVYRLLFLEGELLDILLRRPPRVTGDGRSRIGDLIAAENRRRIAGGGNTRLMLVSIDLDCIFTLAAAGLTLDSVLPEGMTVAVKTVTNQSGAQDTETVRDDVSPELIAEAASAANLVGVKLAGVDVITPDPSRSLTGAGGVIIEVNGGPGLHYHYQVLDPTRATRVAVPILRRLLGRANSGQSAG